MKKWLERIQKIIHYVGLLLKLLHALKELLNKNNELEIIVNNKKKPG